MEDFLIQVEKVVCKKENNEMNLNTIHVIKTHSFLTKKGFFLIWSSFYIWILLEYLNWKKIISCVVGLGLGSFTLMKVNFR